MARYLLHAPDTDMERWKADAATAGVSFAEWLRQAAEARLGESGITRSGLEATDGASPEPAAVAPPQSIVRPVVAEAKRTYAPDPKPSRR